MKKIATVLAAALLSACLMTGCANSSQNSAVASGASSQPVQSTEQSTDVQSSDVQSSVEQASDVQSSVEQPSDVQSSVEQPSVEQPSDEQASDVQSSVEQNSDELNEAAAPEELLKEYEKQINGLLKNQVPLGNELLATTFEAQFGNETIKAEISGGLDELNNDLLGIFEKADFENRYGAVPDEVFEFDSYKNLGNDYLDNSPFSDYKAYFNMPEIEEVRSYPVDIYMAIGSDKRKWTSTNWVFAKADGRWYLVYSLTNLNVS